MDARFQCQRLECFFSRTGECGQRSFHFPNHELTCNDGAYMLINAGPLVILLRLVATLIGVAALTL